MNYKTYAEAKIANPDSEIVTTDKDWTGCSSFAGVFQKINDGGRCVIGDEYWVICNPADYCSSLKEFLGAGFKLVAGDKYIENNGKLMTIAPCNLDIVNSVWANDSNRFIISAAALNGGCKIPAKAEEWTIYNNTLPLCELTDEQAAMLFNAWRNGGNMQAINDDEEWIDYNSGFYPLDVYRIKPKSGRELFIENTTQVMRDAGTKCPDNHKYFGIMFDAGARYKDLTQHFGESI